ncbi:MAG: T9SS type A sorting domain-containing protein [Cytophagales bacterium]
MKTTFYTIIILFCICFTLSAQVVVSTLAGSGTAGYLNDFTQYAKFNSPWGGGLAVDKNGDIYFADQLNNVIRKISRGVVTTYKGDGFAGTGDSYTGNPRFNMPYSVAFDTAGNLFVADKGNKAIRKITPAGIVSTYYQGGLISPKSIAIANNGDMYVGDSNRIVFIDALKQKIRLPLVGDLYNVNGMVDSVGLAAKFNNVTGLSLDKSNRFLYVADFLNDRVRKVDLSSKRVTTVAAYSVGYSGALAGPCGITCDGNGNLYVVERARNHIRKIDANDRLHWFAGDSAAFKTGAIDGTAFAARFKGPGAIAIDASGNLYISDSYNYKIRKITFPPITVGVQDEYIIHNSNIYPNPAKDKITVVANGSELLSIYNAMGNLVHQQTIHGTQEIDINDLTSGLYLYNLGAKRGKLVIK